MSEKKPKPATLFQSPFSGDFYTAVDEDGLPIYEFLGLPVYGQVEMWAEKERAGEIRITEINDAYYEIKLI